MWGKGNDNYDSNHWNRGDASCSAYDSNDWDPDDPYRVVPRDSFAAPIKGVYDDYVTNGHSEDPFNSNKKGDSLFTDRGGKYKTRNPDNGDGSSSQDEQDVHEKKLSSSAKLATGRPCVESCDDDSNSNREDTIPERNRKVIADRSPQRMNHLKQDDRHLLFGTGSYDSNNWDPENPYGGMSFGGNKAYDSAEGPYGSTLSEYGSSSTSNPFDGNRGDSLFSSIKRKSEKERRDSNSCSTGGSDKPKRTDDVHSHDVIGIEGRKNGSPSNDSPLPPGRLDGGDAAYDNHNRSLPGGLYGDRFTAHDTDDWDPTDPYSVVYQNPGQAYGSAYYGNNYHETTTNPFDSEGRDSLFGSVKKERKASLDNRTNKADDRYSDNTEEEVKACERSRSHPNDKFAGLCSDKGDGKKGSQSPDGRYYDGDMMYDSNTWDPNKPYGGFAYGSSSCNLDNPHNSRDLIQSNPFDISRGDSLFRHSILREPRRGNTRSSEQKKEAQKASRDSDRERGSGASPGRSRNGIVDHIENGSNCSGAEDDREPTNGLRTENPLSSGHSYGIAVYASNDWNPGDPYSSVWGAYNSSDWTSEYTVEDENGDNGNNLFDRSKKANALFGPRIDYINSDEDEISEQDKQGKTTSPTNFSLGNRTVEIEGDIFEGLDGGSSPVRGTRSWDPSGTVCTNDKNRIEEQTFFSDESQRKPVGARQIFDFDKHTENASKDNRGEVLLNRTEEPNESSKGFDFGKPVAAVRDRGTDSEIPTNFCGNDESSPDLETGIRRTSLDSDLGKASNNDSFPGSSLASDDSHPREIGFSRSTYGMDPVPEDSVPESAALNFNTIVVHNRLHPSAVPEPVLSSSLESSNVDCPSFGAKKKASKNSCSQSKRTRFSDEPSPHSLPKTKLIRFWTVVLGVFVVLGASAAVTIVLVSSGNGRENDNTASPPELVTSPEGAVVSSLFDNPAVVQWHLHGQVLNVFPNATHDLDVDLRGGLVSGVEISSDGTKLVVGTLYRSALVYQWNATTASWDEEANLEFPVITRTPRAPNQLTPSVALSGNGRRVVIGVSSEGRAYSYDYRENKDPVWLRHVQPILENQAGDGTGARVSLSHDGVLVAVGAPFFDGNALHSGQTRIFRHNSVAWEVEAYVEGQVLNDNVGSRVHMSAGGMTLVDASPEQNTENGFSSGIAWSWRRPQSSPVDEEWELHGPALIGPSSLDKFGSQIDISANGHAMAISSPGFATGVVFVYEYNYLDKVWQPRGSPIPARGSVGVCMSADGNVVVVATRTNAQVFQYQVARTTASGLAPPREWVEVGGSFFNASQLSGNIVACSADGRIVALGRSLPGDASTVSVFRAVEPV